MDYIWFYAFAAVTVLASLFVVGQKNPMYSVMSLIVSFGALAGLYVLLDAPFTAVTQIIIYAGAIMVLFLFVVMLLNVPREEHGPAGVAQVIGQRGLRIGAVLSLLLGVEIVWAISRVGLTTFGEDPAAASVSSVRRIGQVLFTDPQQVPPGADGFLVPGFAFAFEATSILILVAMIGAVVIARRER